MLGAYSSGAHHALARLGVGAPIAVSDAVLGYEYSLAVPDLRSLYRSMVFSATTVELGGTYFLAGLYMANCCCSYGEFCTRFSNLN